VISTTIERRREALAQATGLSAGAYLDRFLQETNFIPAIERSAPHLLEEVRGIADGANVAFADLYAYQLIDEQWLFTGRLLRERQPVSAEHCTALGVFAPQANPPILAQNMDIPKFYDGSQTLLFISGSGGAGVDCVWTIAGIIGAMGVNRHGVGVCCNTVSQLAHSLDGLPVAFIVRRILDHPTRADAVAFVKSVRHASGQNYTIGGPDGITSLECSANMYLEYTPSPGIVFHTNHPVVNDERAQAGPEADPADRPSGDPPTNSELRFEAISRGLGHSTSLTVETVKSLLSNAESLVCATREAPSPSFTASSMVAELGSPPVVHITGGPPHQASYATYRLGSEG
jgi:hypothetical protein